MSKLLCPAVVQTKNESQKTLIFLFCVSPVSRALRFAESEGFEPPIRRNAYTAFRVRLFRPLRQLSQLALERCVTRDLRDRAFDDAFVLCYAFRSEYRFTSIPPESIKPIKTLAKRCFNRRGGSTSTIRIAGR